MANLLAAEHVRPGEHVELTTPDGALRVHGVEADDRVLLGSSQLRAGQHVELRGPSGSIPAIGVAHVEGVTLLASTNIRPGHGVELNTATGTLRVTGYDPRDLPPPTAP